jgi:hypothetical protein
MMAGNLSAEQRNWILKEFWKTENAERVRRAWIETFNTPPPTRLTIYRIRGKFDATGSVANAPKSRRPRTSDTKENEARVAMTFVKQFKKSTRRAAQQLSLPRTSLRRLMRKLNFKPYRPKLLHCLLQVDTDRQLQFCEIMRNQISDERDLIHKIIWSDSTLCVVTKELP